MARVGLMGGTFDPVHHGHLLIAEQVRPELDLDRIVFIPAGSPPHKQRQEVTTAEHRYVMVSLATAPNPSFFTSRVELDREGASFAVDTIRHFLEAGCATEDLFFITGADAILEILTSHRHEEAIRLCTFVAVARPGYDLRRMRELPAGYQERIRVVQASALDISSTEIRARIRAGRPIRYLVPDPVDAYIRKHALYTGSRGD